MGETTGAGCNPSIRGQIGHIALCSGWEHGSVQGMLRARVPVDLQLIIGGLLLGTFLGVAAGRWCAAYPRAWITRGPRGVIAVLLSCPPYFLALVFLVLFSWNSGDYKIPFVSGQGDYRPFADDPLGFTKAMWVPWVCCALPLAALVSRIAEASMNETLGEDFIRTARSEGLTERRSDRHALPVATPAVTAMTGVNVSTMLIHGRGDRVRLRAPRDVPDDPRCDRRPGRPRAGGAGPGGCDPRPVANFIVDTLQARMDPRIRTRNDG